MTKTVSREKSRFFIVVDFSDGEKKLERKISFFGKRYHGGGGGG